MYSEIKTEKDIQDFLEKTNQLHDGHIISAIYTYNGIEKTEDGHCYSPWMKTLTLQVLVTSIFDTVVEIKFENIFRWSIGCPDEIFFDTVSITRDGWIVWSTDVCPDISNINNVRPENCSFVIAGSMKWRIID